MINRSSILLREDFFGVVKIIMVYHINIQNYQQYYEKAYYLIKVFIANEMGRQQL